MHDAASVVRAQGWLRPGLRAKVTTLGSGTKGFGEEDAGCSAFDTRAQSHLREPWALEPRPSTEAPRRSAFRPVSAAWAPRAASTHRGLLRSWPGHGLVQSGPPGSPVRLTAGACGPGSSAAASRSLRPGGCSETHRPVLFSGCRGCVRAWEPARGAPASGASCPRSTAVGSSHRGAVTGPWGGRGGARATLPHRHSCDWTPTALRAGCRHLGRLREGKPRWLLSTLHNRP